MPKSVEGLLMRGKVNIITRTVAPGIYYHLGLQVHLQKLSKHTLQNNSTILLDIGIDGLPLYKSSNTSLWPILGNIVNLKNLDVFLIGVYVGKHKPNDVDNYLHDFIYELKKIKEEGINLHEVNIKVEIRAFICDAPGRSFLCNVVGHNSLNGCMKCYQKGKRIGNVTTYSSSMSNLRTDTEFYNRNQKEFHKHPYVTNQSILEDYGIQMVTQFPVEPMHLVDLGVTKKMLGYLIKNKSKTQITDSKKKIISQRLIELGPYIPKEFQRKPRDLEELARWKATEYRQFILYYGPIVLQNVVDEDFYYELLLLHTSYRLLSTPKHFNSNIDSASELLAMFVENFCKVFGESSITFNVHSLLHLPQCVKDFGIAQTFSAYSFENFLQKLKNRIRKPSQICQQIRNQFLTASIERIEKSSKFNKSKNGKIRSFQTENFFLSTARPNNFCIIEPYIPVMITGFSEEKQSLRGIRIENLRSFFKEPVDSTSLGICLGDLKTKDEEWFEIEKVYGKITAFPKENSLLLIPLLHTCH